MENQEPQIQLSVVSVCQSSELGKLAEALAKAQGSYPEIPKTKTANVGSYSYKYAGLADILNGTRKALSVNHLSVTQLITSSEKGQFLTSRLLHSSGQWVESNYELPRGRSPQAFGSELTYARRYSLCALIGVEGDEDDDGKGAESEGNKKPPPKPAPKKPESKNVTLKDVNDLKALAKAKGYDKEEVAIASQAFFGNPPNKITKVQCQTLSSMISKWEPTELMAKADEKMNEK